MQSTESVLITDKYQVIVARSPLALLLLCGFLSCAILFTGGFFIYNEFVLSGEIVGKRSVDLSLVLVGAISSLVVGAAAAALRRYEYITMGMTYKKGEFFKLHLFFLYIFFFVLLVYPAFFLVLPAWTDKGARSASAVFPVLLILTVLVGWLLRNLWDLVFRFLLRVLSPVDWALHLDRVHFQRMMRLKFAEVMRYQGPLTLIMIGLQDFEGLKKKLSRRKILKLQAHAMEFINGAVRNLDIVGRIGEGQFIATLVHTAGMDARVPAERILKKMETLVHEGGFRKDAGIRFSLGLASYDQSMTSEEDLIRKAQTALNRALSEGEGIVYL